MNQDHYILGPDNELVVADLLTWARWLETSGARRIVAKDEVHGKIVSTVFLGLDHQFGPGGPPLLFETMIFPSVTDYSEEYMERYSTWDEAAAKHKLIVEHLTTSKTGKIDYD